MRKKCDELMSAYVGNLRLLATRSPVQERTRADLVDRSLQKLLLGD